MNEYIYKSFSEKFESQKLRHELLSNIRYPNDINYAVMDPTNTNGHLELIYVKNAGMDVDHAPRPRRVVGQSREGRVDSGRGGADCRRICSRGAGLGKQPAATAALEERQRRSTSADAGAAEKRAAAGLEMQVLAGGERMVHGFSSSRGSRPD